MSQKYSEKDREIFFFDNADMLILKGVMREEESSLLYDLYSKFPLYTGAETESIEE